MNRLCQSMGHDFIRYEEPGSPFMCSRCGHTVPVFDNEELTLKEQMRFDAACAALTGLVGKCPPPVAVKAAFEYADALINEMNKEEESSILDDYNKFVENFKANSKEMYGETRQFIHDNFLELLAK